MNNPKGRQQRTRGRQPTNDPLNTLVDVPASPPLNPVDEHRSWQRRRALLGAGVAALLVLLAVGAYLLWPRSAQTVAPTIPNAPQVPVAVVPEPPSAAAPITSSGIDCVAIEGLTILENARCIEQNRDDDDGVVKLENTYVVASSADDVRRFFEGQFQQNGWQTHEAQYDAEDMTWEYEIAQGPRRVDLSVEGEQNDGGSFTRIKIEEK